MQTFVGGERQSLDDTFETNDEVNVDDESFVDSIMQAGKFDDSFVENLPLVTTRTFDPPEAEFDQSGDFTFEFRRSQIRRTTTISERRRLMLIYDVSQIDGFGDLDPLGNPVMVRADLITGTTPIGALSGIATSVPRGFTVAGFAIDQPLPTDAAEFDAAFASQANRQAETGGGARIITEWLPDADADQLVLLVDNQDADGTPQDRAALLNRAVLHVYRYRPIGLTDPENNWRDFVDFRTTDDGQRRWRIRRRLRSNDIEFGMLSRLLSLRSGGPFDFEFAIVGEDGEDVFSVRIDDVVPADSFVGNLPGFLADIDASNALMNLEIATLAIAGGGIDPVEFKLLWRPREGHGLNVSMFGSTIVVGQPGDAGLDRVERPVVGTLDNAVFSTWTDAGTYFSRGRNVTLERDPSISPRGFAEIRVKSPLLIPTHFAYLETEVAGQSRGCPPPTQNCPLVGNQESLRFATNAGWFDRNESSLSGGDACQSIGVTFMPGLGLATGGSLGFAPTRDGPARRHAGSSGTVFDDLFCEVTLTSSLTRLASGNLGLVATGQFGLLTIDGGNFDPAGNWPTNANGEFLSPPVRFGAGRELMAFAITQSLNWTVDLGIADLARMADFPAITLRTIDADDWDPATMGRIAQHRIASFTDFQASMAASEAVLAVRPLSAFSIHITPQDYHSFVPE